MRVVRRGRPALSRRKEEEEEDDDDDNDVRLRYFVLRYVRLR